MNHCKKNTIYLLKKNVFSILLMYGKIFAKMWALGKVRVEMYINCTENMHNSRSLHKNVFLTFQKSGENMRN